MQCVKVLKWQYEVNTQFWQVIFSFFVNWYVDASILFFNYLSGSLCSISIIFQCKTWMTKPSIKPQFSIFFTQTHECPSYSTRKEELAALPCLVTWSLVQYSCNSSVSQRHSFALWYLKNKYCRVLQEYWEVAVCLSCFRKVITLMY